MSVVAVAFATLLEVLSGDMNWCPHQSESEAASTQSGISVVRGKPGDPTLEAKLRMALVLPMEEVEFIALMQDHGFSTRRMGDDGSSLPALPLPRYIECAALGRVDHGLLVDGGSTSRRTERYRAYISDLGQVVYVENDFQYDP